MIGKRVRTDMAQITPGQQSEIDKAMAKLGQKPGLSAGFLAGAERAKRAAAAAKQEKLETTDTETREVALDAIKRDQRAQPRDHLNTEKTAEYAEAMAGGDQFPPLTVFFDGADYWLADGFHRAYAAQGANLKTFPCRVHQGGLRDAILHSVGANATHGYPRTNADKRRAVQRLLDDAEWAGWSDREIAKWCHVHHDMVSKLRPKAEAEPDTGGNRQNETRTFIHPKTGQPTTMKTGGINADRPKPQLPTMPPAVEDAPAAEPPHAAPPTPITVQPPAHSPLTMEPEQKAAFDADTANSFIANRLWDIEKMVRDVLPPAAEAAQRFPSRLLHTFSAEQARTIRDWFDGFATEFEQTREVSDVAAE